MRILQDIASFMHIATLPYAAVQGPISGWLYISEIDGKPADTDLRIENQRLVATRGFSKFTFYMGTIRYPRGEQYLVVNEKGKVELGIFPQTGFFLKTEKMAIRTLVTLNGKCHFELCGDRSIGHHSNCSGAKPISINFESI